MTLGLIPSQRALFDLPREVAYLNCAYMSPLLVEAVEAGRRALERKARPWTIRPADFFTGTERARALFARLIGGDADGVALVPAASYGIATAARNLEFRAGQTVVVAADQFPSNVNPWVALAAERGGSVVAAAPGEDGDLTAALLGAIGRAGAEDFSRLVDYAPDYAPGARRFDMGEAPNFALLPPLCVALERLLDWGPEAIQRTLAARTAGIAARAAALGSAPRNPTLRAGHFLGLGFPGPPPRDLPERLAGAGIHVSLRGESLRVTPNLWNDDADVDRLIEALASAL